MAEITPTTAFCGLSRELVLQLSVRKNDPDWVRDLRLEGWRLYEQLPLPSWGPDLSGLDLSQIVTYVEPRSQLVDDWSQVPPEIRQNFQDLGIPQAEINFLAGVGAQFDSEMVYHRVQEMVAAYGVVYEDLETAIHGQYSTMIQEHFLQLIKPSEHKFMALHAAVWSGGSFVYIPPGVSVTVPLQSYFRLNAKGAGQFEHTLIIVGEGADLHFIEGCSAPRYNVASLHAGAVEIYVRPGAKVRYTTIENWSRNMYNLNTKRAWVAAGAHMEWISGSFGSCATALYPATLLAGEGATLTYTGVTFAGAGQNLDTGLKVTHQAPATKSVVHSKSLSKDGGGATFRSSVVMTSEALGSKSFTDCQSLLLDDKSRSDAIPVFDVRAADVAVGHEARIGQISEEMLFYLRSRGLSGDEARLLVVNGFVDDLTRELPLEYAVELNNLIRLEMRPRE